MKTTVRIMTASERQLHRDISAARNELLGRGHIRRIREDRRRAESLRRLKLMYAIAQAVRS